ncbi:MAG: hypothetical protein WHT84_01085 [Breznakiellaceae bacterium]|jgi:hypothetical protein
MRVLVSGLVNIETTLQIDAFPLEYEPVRYPFWGIQSTVLKGFSAQEALKRAMVFASWKIGSRGAAQGFLNAREFEQVYSQVEGTAK